MKYALIALVAIYLIVTYGCSPEDSEHTPDAQETAVQGQAEDSHQKTEAVEDETAITEPAQFVVGQVVTVESDEIVAPVATEEKPGSINCTRHSITATEGKAQMPCHVPPQPQAFEESNQDLSAAMQRMVEATNDMVLVTKELITTTQEMLKASKGVAREVLDTGKEILEADKNSHQTQVQTEPGVENVEQPVIQEKDVVETMKDLVAATKAMIEATDKALEEALEAQRQKE